ncbi:MULTISPECIES: hypothetical protein [unclassified Enterococcus]|uniref:hypothetical protein n=1 Tax=unclassified Enterococcus TaxID=2608891 RepID=UPI001554D776|nr:MULTISPECIES: hypothetical protein [unclassified Enterococcus]MBS7576092.1 hypothetical protein [Enterococcus sp. MMGLQ5-2]MBS7583325.1 hypothetical protein [Enterococcus sp. MMGLQ5-1]NPD11185.1 hypothetical protein [Enterococcus sp. MMGLQ5-1]NPD35928.1 hypothetical protein [Enterococcus sp. MMGLQ5-2]
MSKLQWNDENYINQIKKEAGYSSDSKNLTVMKKGNFLQRRLGLSALFLSMYNLSIEKNGLLLIKRSKYSPQLQPSKMVFIEKSQIIKINLNKKIGALELLLVMEDSPKIEFRLNDKNNKFIPWQELGISELEKFIANCNSHLI